MPYLRHPYTIWDLTPASFAAPHEMERVGRLGDGGKWVCGLSRYEARATAEPARPLVVYSLGVGQESSWEAALLTRVPMCEVWGYDHSVTDWAAQLDDTVRPRAHFFRTGIAGTTSSAAEGNGNGEDPGFRTIQNLMRINGHEYMYV